MFAALKLGLGDTLYHLLIFAALLLLVKHFAWGPVAKMMERRCRKVISNLDQAESGRKKAAFLANQCEAVLKDSKQEAAQISSTARSNAEKTKSSIISQADQETAAIKERTSEDAVRAKTDALSEARDQVADISVAIAEKVTSKSLSVADQRDLVDQFVKGLSD